MELAATIVRVFNAIGCSVALYLLFTAARQQWDSWNFKTQQHWWALIGWVGLGLEGVIEALIMQTEPGPRVILQALVVTWTLRAITIRDELRVEPILHRRETT